MTRGGKRRDSETAERKCIVTGEVQPKEGLIRFVVGPDGDVVPDILGKLPGRGMYVTATQAALAKAGRGQFSRSAKGPVTVPDGLVAQVEGQLARQVVNLIGLARKANKRIHILHISTAEELPILAANKDLVTCEILPNHLSIIGPEAYEVHQGRVQQNPPIRDAQNAAMLWEGVRQGIFDVMGTDHAPHTLEEKAKPYPASPSGMPGVQTLVPLMLDWVNKGALTLERFVDLVCHGPNRVWGIAGKGRLSVGYDADITIVDLKKTGEIRDEDQANISGWTPYHGKTVTGWPTHTIIDGKIIMAEGDVVLEGQGKPYRFTECL